MDAQAESGDCRASITKDVPILRVDNLSTKSSLLRMRRSQFPKTPKRDGLTTKKDATILTILLAVPPKDIEYEKHQICCDSEPRR